MISRPVCSRYNNSFATRQSLWNYKQRCRGMQYDEQKNKETFHDYRKDDYQVLGHNESADRSRKPNKVQKLVKEDDNGIPTFENEFIRKKQDVV